MEVETLEQIEASGLRADRTFHQTGKMRANAKQKHMSAGCSKVADKINQTAFSGPEPAPLLGPP